MVHLPPSPYDFTMPHHTIPHTTTLYHHFTIPPHHTTSNHSTTPHQTTPPHPIKPLHHTTSNHTIIPHQTTPPQHHSSDESIRGMWPEGATCITAVTRRPGTAGSNFKNAIVALVKNLNSKVAWCGVLWFGVLWCGVLWCAVLWCVLVCCCFL